jgi:hypothetical protein
MASTQRNNDGNGCRDREANHRRQQGPPKLASPKHYKQGGESNGRCDHHCQGPRREKEQDENGYHRKNIISVLHYMHIQFSVWCSSVCAETSPHNDAIKTADGWIG